MPWAVPGSDAGQDGDGEAADVLGDERVEIGCRGAFQFCPAIPFAGKPTESVGHAQHDFESFMVCNVCINSSIVTKTSCWLPCP